jgi:hypothetical protein
VQGAHDGVGALGRGELSVEQPLGGVVQDGNEGLLRRGPQGEPGVAAAVQVQQLAEAGPGLAAPAVAASGPAFAHQPRLLKGELDEAVGQRHAVIPAGEVVKVADVEPGVAVPRPVAVAVQA